MVAVLDLETAPADRSAIESRWGAGLEPAHAETEAVEALGQTEGRGFADAAGRDPALADMDQTAQERAGGQHHGAGAKAASVGP
jgi:hypothetical protein